MTTEEIKLLNAGGVPTPTKLFCPQLPNGFKPQGQNEYNEGIPEKPDPKRDFNQMPLADIEHLSESRHMDDLHRVDALSEEYKKGENLKSIHKSLGKDKFKNIYSTLKQK